MINLVCSFMSVYSFLNPNIVNFFQVSKLQPFPSSSVNMIEHVTKKKTSSSSLMADWTLLPEELLHIILMHMEDCFDVVHARSICNLWRSTFPLKMQAYVS